MSMYFFFFKQKTAYEMRISDRSSDVCSSDLVDVRRGERVRRGQRIGTVGTTGRSTGPHLHWAVNWLDQRLDPELVAGTMPGASRRGDDGWRADRPTPEQTFF